jgi:hypothetical protein
MRGAVVLEELSRRAPVVLAIGLCTALLSYWTQAPLWLPYSLALILGSLALILMATRGRRRRLRKDTDSGETGWLAQELAGNGSPSGTYLLGFFDVVTIALTGFQGAYATPGWAGLALTAAWAIANAHYPPGDQAEP